MGRLWKEMIPQISSSTPIASMSMRLRRAKSTRKRIMLRYSSAALENCSALVTTWSPAFNPLMTCCRSVLLLRPKLHRYAAEMVSARRKEHPILVVQVDDGRCRHDDALHRLAGHGTSLLRTCPRA